MKTLQERLRRLRTMSQFVSHEDMIRELLEDCAMAADAIDELAEALEGVGRFVSHNQFAHAQRLIAKYKEGSAK
jgi:hypothetical protein